MILLRKNWLGFDIILEIGDLNGWFDCVRKLDSIVRYCCLERIEDCVLLLLLIRNRIEWKSEFKVKKVCFLMDGKCCL